MSDISSFDPAMFLDMTLDEPTIRRAPLPVGDYLAVLGEVTARRWTSKNDSTKSGIAWDVPMTIEVPSELQSSLSLPPTLNNKDSIMVDVTAGGGMDNGPGKNRQIRNYREALDLNKPGDTFSARAMSGRMVRVKITHELYNGDIQERIGGVTKS
jgi:hypothetical protein